LGGPQGLGSGNGVSVRERYRLASSGGMCSKQSGSRRVRSSACRLLTCVVSLVALTTCGWVARGASASAAVAGGATRIVSPAANQVVGSGDGVKVVLRSRTSLRQLQIFVDGQPVDGYFNGSDGIYRATLRVGSGLHLGTDELLVVTGAGAELNHVSFIVARPAPELLGLSALQVGGDRAPVRVAASIAPGATLQAWVNGHRDDDAFQPQGAGYVGLLGGNDWLQSGKNRVTVLAYRTSPSGRDASYVVKTRTFWRRPGTLTAGAGPDQITTDGQFIRLHGSVSVPGSAQRVVPRVTYSWRVVGRPRGAVARLYDAGSKTPGFEANAPGDYLVATKVVAANGSSSVDTATVTEILDTPPIGVRLATAADDRGTITLDGAPVPATTEPCQPDQGGCTGRGSYAIYNRETLARVASGNVVDNPESGGISTLANLATSHTGGQRYLMVANFQALAEDPKELADGRELLRTLGAPTMSDAEMNRMLTSAAPVSIIGMPGSPAGSGFVSDHFLERSPYPAPSFARQVANMSGYLRFNPLSVSGGYFDFVFPDQAEFNTDASPSPSQIRMYVAGSVYAHDAPTDGSSGFFLVRLDSQTLALDQDFFYVTNRPDGTEIPAEAKRMADDIAWATSKQNDHGQLLLILQAFGKPKGTSAGWLQAADAIGKLGGNAQVFAQLNQRSSDEPHEGRYAFVGRSSMDVHGAVSSQPLTGRAADGRLQGLLARGRDGQYEPLIADPAGTVNFDLVSIVNRAPAPDGGFPAFTPGQGAAASFLGRDPDIIGVCVRTDPTCDVRKAYYQRYAGTNWNTILTRLGSDYAKQTCDASHPGFTPDDCNTARHELEREIGRRNTVAEYFGQGGLQAPFGTAQVAALVDVATIAEQIREAVKPPPADNATANAMNILSYIARIGGFAGAIYPQALGISAGLGGAFALAAYQTKDNGTPDLIGPKVTAAAVNLGSKLYERYQDASGSFTTEAKIIISDWPKLRDVSALISNPRWALDTSEPTVLRIRLATQQTIYQSLIPVAYPVLYDLGTHLGNAKDWQCSSPPPLVSKHLFQTTEGGAQLSWTMTSDPYVGQRHLIAVGARYTRGTTRDAYIPAPPDSITKPLFREPSEAGGGGIGLYKLDFYSPQFFEVFGTRLRARNGDWLPCTGVPNPPGNAGAG
jgi:hypothetical protein